MVLELTFVIIIHGQIFYPYSLLFHLSFVFETRISEDFQLADEQLKPLQNFVVSVMLGDKEVGMATSTKFPLQVFYDGSCAICSREMQISQRRECADRLVFFDISDPGFRAKEHGRKLEDFMKELHVRDAENQFHTGVSAFAIIWSAFPESPLYSTLERILNLPGIRQGADIGYATFARFRHLLPNTRCHDVSCRLH